MTELHLPWPPSVNTYYRHVGSRVLISSKGRKYREAVHAIIRDLKIEKILEDCSVQIDAFPPDRRERDIDNIMKALFDAVQKGELIKKDSQIKVLNAYMRPPVKGGLIVFRIEPLRKAK